MVRCVQITETWIRDVYVECGEPATCKIVDNELKKVDNEQ